jgi:6-phosphogluconolactonase
MYVTASEDNKISIFEMDSQSGKVKHNQDVEVTGRPAPLAMDAGQKFLYVGRRDINEISSYAIDKSTGGLSFLGTVTVEADPCYLGIDRKNKFLLSAYYNGAHAAVHAINADGTLQQTPVEWYATATGAHCMQTDPSNRFAFVPHIANRGGPNAIFQFRFDENTGHITPNSPFKLEMNGRLGPRHYCFHPTKDIVYVSDEQGCSVSAYNLDTSKGTLSHFQTTSTLPDGYDGENSCAQIRISPSGKFVYAPNRGHNSIACFSVDDVSGELTRFDIVPSEPVPRAIELDPQGRFLVAAGLDSGKLASYTINQTSGKLTPLETWDVGKAPMWVMIREM